jgi:hypothetical protein
MELIIESIESSSQLQDLKDMCNPIISRFPALNYFSEYMDCAENKTIHFNFDEIDHIVIVGELRNGELVVTPRSFVNSLYISKLSQSLDEYVPHILAYYKNQEISKIRIRTAPTYIQYSEKLIADSLLEHRCTTSIVEVINYSLSSRRSRSLKKAYMMGYQFELAGQANVIETWRFMENFLVSRQLPTLSISRILELVTDFDQSFSLCRVTDHRSRLIGAALINKIGNCIRIPNYYGSRDDEGATDFLISNIIELAIMSKMEFVDLGVSSDPLSGMEIEGIVNYKSEFSAKRFVVRDEVIIL